jgi:hypothetical protein
MEVKQKLNPPRIDSYRFGQIVIDGLAYTEDVIVFPDRVLGGWWRKAGHLLQLEDLADVFEASPDVLIVGQGANGRMAIASETKEALEQAGIFLIPGPTEAACQTYNRLRGQAERVVAALHLTC